MKRTELRWIFDEKNNRVTTENDELTVFYTDDLECPNKVVEKVVDIRNNNMSENYELLGSKGEIDKYLLNEPNCTQDDREIIVEDIFSFFKNGQ